MYKPTQRRKFIKKSLLASISLVMGTKIVYGNSLPYGLLPINFDTYVIPPNLPGKSELLRVLNDRPINAETPAHLLDDELTPNNLFFVRNNGLPPSNISVSNWTLSISGESIKNKKTFSLDDLKDKFKHHTLNLTLECGGNGRSEFNPPAKGNQWSTGAIGCAAWTGVKLKDLLIDCGVRSDAVYIGYLGADLHLSGNPDKRSISRGVPLQKAMEDESLIAWSMNGEDMPVLNGYPLRLIFGGYPASCSGKWLTDILVRNKVHDGAKMGGQSYRTPCEAVAPGAKVSDEDMCIIENMPVKSLITFPKTGAMINLGQKLPFRGHAWTSANEIKKVEYSIDFGMNWQTCELRKGQNRYAWQRFNGELTFPEKGYYELWAKATDSESNTQPIILPGWNPKGYLNNACHRIAVKVQ